MTQFMPILKSVRLRLAPPTPNDTDALLEFFQSKYSRFYGGPMTHKQAWEKLCNYAGQWLLRGYGPFVIKLKINEKPLGMIGPVHPAEFDEPEMSWFLCEKGLEGHGFITESAHIVLDYLSNSLRWKNVVSYIDKENLASIKVAERLKASIDSNARPPLSLKGCIVYKHDLHNRDPKN